MAAIREINDLVVAESFLQINLVKGYTYIDRAGEIVNYFYKPDNTPPQFTMDLRGLIIENPDEKTDEVKISSNTFWAHFVSPDSLEIMDNFFGKKTKDILDILEVKEIDRIGWRSYFVYETNSDDVRQNILKKFIPVDGFEFDEVSYTSSFKEFLLNIKVRKVKKTTSSETPALLIDVDVYKKFQTDDLFDAKNISVELLEFKKFIRSNDFLGIINSVLVE